MEKYFILIFTTTFLIGNISCEDVEEQTVNVTDYRRLDGSCLCESPSNYRLQATFGCRQYCTCKSNDNHRGKYRTCPKGMVFNQKIENCDYKTNFKCLKLPKANYTCKKYPTDRFPDVCSLYVWCVDKKPITMPCPAGLHYCHSDVCYSDPRCTSRHEAKCPFNETSLDVFDCPGDGVFADPKNCSMFFHCTYGIPHHKACASGDRTAFNPLSGKCEDRSNVNCSEGRSSDVTSSVHRYISTTSISTTTDSNDGGNTDTTTSVNVPTVSRPPITYGNEDMRSWSTPVPPEIFTCPENIGLYADVKNCSRFFHCSNWLAYPKECAFGLHFNPSLNVCDFRRMVNCKS